MNFNRLFDQIVKLKSAKNTMEKCDEYFKGEVPNLDQSIAYDDGYTEAIYDVLGILKDFKE